MIRQMFQSEITFWILFELYMIGCVWSVVVSA